MSPSSDHHADLVVYLIDFPALEPTDSIKAKYDKPFELAYVVTLAEHQISTDLHVKNTGLSTTGPLIFQALFHTYLRAPANEVRIAPLKNVNFYDKTEATEELRAQAKSETREAVDVLKFTDSVYENAPGTYQVSWPGGGVEVKSRNLKDVVVWNPQAEAGAKIGDMEAGGWCVRSITLAGFLLNPIFRRERYVCLEPGHVRGFLELPAGETWIGQQVITVADSQSSKI